MAKKSDAAVIINKKRTLKGRKLRYPWSEWADGKERKLIKGKNYFVKSACMASAIYAYAGRKGWEATTSIDDNSVTFYITKPK